MKNFNLLIILSLFLSQCNTESKEVVYLYDLYSYDNIFIRQNCMITKILSYNKKEKRVIIEGFGSKEDWYYEDFFEKNVSNKGIYRKFNDEYLLYYRFDSINTTLNFENTIKSRFFWENIYFYDKKIYVVNNKAYTVFAYSEYINNYGVYTYYLENFGCLIYDNHNGYYQRCNRIIGSDFVTNTTLKLLCDTIVKDTCFFSVLRFNPVNRCFSDSIQ